MTIFAVYFRQYYLFLWVRSLTMLDGADRGFILRIMSKI